MKLAEALLTRADMQNRINELSARLDNNALVQEGDAPSEEPAELLAQLDDMTARLERLIAAINLTNAQARPDGVTLTGLLARRDCMKLKLNALRTFLDSASSAGRRARGSEIKLVSTVPVRQMQESVDRQSAELRRLEVEIQSLNWTTDLIE